MEKNSIRPIIVIKRIKKVAPGHHGGAWKVAYADFMTAMMAFFLLLWILSNAEEDKLAELADYFTETTTPLVNIGGQGVLAGESFDGARLGTSTSEEVINPAIEQSDETAAPASEAGSAAENPWRSLASDSTQTAPIDMPVADAIGNIAERADRIADQLSAFAENIQVDVDGDTISIEILDVGDAPLFRPGSSELTPANLEIVQKIVEIVSVTSGEISITGHTDSTPYRGNGAYGNWELSADRANATRRAMIDSGLPEYRIIKVSGAAAMDLMVQDDPLAASNRRVTVDILPLPAVQP